MTPERGYQLELAPSPVFAVSREESRDQIAERFVLATQGRFVGDELDSRIDHIQSLSGLRYIAELTVSIVNSGGEVMNHRMIDEMRDEFDRDLVELYVDRLEPHVYPAIIVGGRLRAQHDEIIEGYRNNPNRVAANVPLDENSPLLYRVVFID